MYDRKDISLWIIMLYVVCPSERLIALLLSPVIIGVVCMDRSEHGVHIWRGFSAQKSCWRGIGYKPFFHSWPSFEGANSSSAFEWEKVVYTLLLMDSPVAFEHLCVFFVVVVVNVWKAHNEANIENVIIEVYAFFPGFISHWESLIIKGSTHCMWRSLVF